jgi:hypothetical protein
VHTNRCGKERWVGIRPTAAPAGDDYLLIEAYPPDQHLTSAGIAIDHVPGFVVAQLVGAAAAAILSLVMFAKVEAAVGVRPQATPNACG